MIASVGIIERQRVELIRDVPDHSASYYNWEVDVKYFADY
jgi:hypothetical protein